VIYLTSPASTKAIRETLAAGLTPELGLLHTPRDPRGAAVLGRYPHWAADTGCFHRPDEFDLDEYLGWLEGLPFRERCLFATAPDVVGDAAATLELAGPCLPDIRMLGLRGALVAQDGLEALPVPWDWFDCLFLGGSTAWKLSEGALALAGEARERGKWVHMGRVNSLRRLRLAEIAGCHSADGSFLAFGPDTNLPRLLGWLGTMRRQPILPLWA